MNFFFFFARRKAKSSLKLNALQIFCKSVNPVKRREERERLLSERVMELGRGRGEILLDWGGFWSKRNFISNLGAQGGVRPQSVTEHQLGSCCQCHPLGKIADAEIW